MTYFFTDPGGMEGFLALAKALIGGKRKLPLLPPVERGIYEVQRKSAAPRVKVGADVLPWWPVKGVYLLLERGDAPTDALLDVDGVAGVWSAARWTSTRSWQARKVARSITYCFLDDDPVATATRLLAGAGHPVGASVCIEPLLAAPFYPIVPHEWDRYVP